MADNNFSVAWKIADASARYFGGRKSEFFTESLRMVCRMRKSGLSLSQIFFQVMTGLFRKNKFKITLSLNNLKSTIVTFKDSVEIKELIKFHRLNGFHIVARDLSTGQIIY